MCGLISMGPRFWPRCWSLGRKTGNGRMTSFINSNIVGINLASTERKASCSPFELSPKCNYRRHSDRKSLPKFENGSWTSGNHNKVYLNQVTRPGDMLRNTCRRRWQAAGFYKGNDGLNCPTPRTAQKFTWMRHGKEKWKEREGESGREGGRMWGLKRESLHGEKSFPLIVKGIVNTNREKGTSTHFLSHSPSTHTYWILEFWCGPMIALAGNQEKEIKYFSYIKWDLLSLFPSPHSAHTHPHTPRRGVWAERLSRTFSSTEYALIRFSNLIFSILSIPIVGLLPGWGYCEGGK